MRSARLETTVLKIAYLVYLVAVGILVFQPTGDQASGSVLWVSHLLHSWHAPVWLWRPVPWSGG